MRPTERERRTIAIGAALSGLIVAYWMFAAGPLAGPEEAGPASTAEHVARLRELVAQRPAIEKALAEARQRRALLRQRLLPAGDPAVSGAPLTSLVERLASENGARIDQRRLAEPVTVHEALRAVPLEVTMATDVFGLRLFLYSLARSGKTLTVDDLRIASLEAGRVGGVSRAGAPPLRVQMTVTGYAPLDVGEEGP